MRGKGAGVIITLPLGLPKGGMGWDCYHSPPPIGSEGRTRDWGCYHSPLPGGWGTDAIPAFQSYSHIQKFCKMFLFKNLIIKIPHDFWFELLISLDAAHNRTLEFKTNVRLFLPSPLSSKISLYPSILNNFYLYDVLQDPLKNTNSNSVQFFHETFKFARYVPTNFSQRGRKCKVLGSHFTPPQIMR